jgi:hypothetical protein
MFHNDYNRFGLDRNRFESYEDFDRRARDDAERAANEREDQRIMDEDARRGREAA